MYINVAYADTRCVDHIDLKVIATGVIIYPFALSESLLNMPFDFFTHTRTAGTALANWWRAASLEALCVAGLWLVGLWLLHVPLAQMWALIGGLMAFVPNFGGVIAILGPVFSILVSGQGMDRLLYLLGLYAVIVVVDQLLIQPLLMKRVTRVPIWASLLAPIVLGILIPFWGVLLAPPLLAVIYAFRRRKDKASAAPSIGEGGSGTT